ncbi:PH domain-containing protein [Mechercharimyces sp. CAU 1602]|uniref:PH domain-containing protein n=1 Tax=Mechercharimyces sp. CAU 1602 TaxID=2973933 RepID=UPI0021633735|nr:PH domain-containing protein [Mechercharimyces sp. CAU 1602]MCS1352713.1 PH domain-containing protein [Mechercharimyces sp. CAU 1602]
MKRFTPKKDIFSYFIVGVMLPLNILILFYSFKDNNFVPYIVSLGPINILFTWLWFGTFYEIREDHLFIRGGPLRWKIPYGSIDRVMKIKSIFASPASLSYEKIEVLHKEGVILISPKREQEFIKKLVEKNKNIQVDI